MYMSAAHRNPDACPICKLDGNMPYDHRAEYDETYKSYDHIYLKYRCRKCGQEWEVACHPQWIYVPVK